MQNDLVLYCGIVLLVMGLTLMGFLSWLAWYQKSHVLTKKAKGQKSFWKQTLLSLYRYLSRFILTKRSIYHIRSRLEIIGTSNEGSLRIKVMKIYGSILLLLGVIFLGVIIMVEDLWMIGLWVVVLWVISETLVDFLVVRLKNRLLWQQIKFNEAVRHRYYQTKMVDEAIYEACESLDKQYFEVRLQGERIIDVLMSKDPEKSMMAYYEVAPNKYLKMFLSLAYMTMEYGDAQFEGVSVFMKNLQDLTNEIRIERVKRERLNYALKSLNIIVLLPLLLIGPVKAWASSYFMPLKQFYDSQTGFLIQIALVVLILICFMLLRRVQQFDQSYYQYSGKLKIEDIIYNKGLNKLIDRIKPKITGKYYHRLRGDLRSTRTTLRVEGFVVRQLFVAVIVFSTSLLLVLFLHYNGRARILNAPTIDTSFLGGQISDEMYARAMETTERDRKYLSKISKTSSFESIVTLVQEETLKLEQQLTIEQAQVIAGRLNEKQIEFYGHHMKLWEVIICLLLAIMAYQLPRVNLSFKMRLMKMEIEDEVSGFTSVILMLMHHERLSVTEVLEWFEMYSTSFVEPIGECLNDMSYGAVEALEDLSMASNNEQFKTIIEGLILASEDITLRQAFDELETEKRFHMEQRKEQNHRIVEKKINLGNMIGFLPVYALIVLYMIVPMIVIGIKDMDQYFSQLQG